MQRAFRQPMLTCMDEHATRLRPRFAKPSGHLLVLYLPIWLYDVSYNGIPKGNLQVQAAFDEQVPTGTGQAHCKDIPVAVPRSESGEWTPLMDSAGPSLIKNWGGYGCRKIPGWKPA